MRPTSFALALCLGLFAVPPIFGQTVPDAGSLRQQIEQGRQQILPPKATPDKPAEPAAMPPQAGVIVTVESFRFEGNTLLAAEQLAPAVAGYLRRPLDYAQLQAAAAAVANAYREAGWIVRAYLPRQDIVDGVVTIRIVEAVFGGVYLEGDAPRRVGRELLENALSALQKVGEPLNAERLDRALLLIDDLPGLTASGSLREGARTGETDLVLSVADEPLTAGEAAVDDAGARSTGPARFVASLNFNSPAGFGDLFTGNLMHSRGSDYARLGYTLPVGAGGWRAGANASALNYHLVAPEFIPLDARGRSGSAGLEASYAVIRSRLKNLYFNINADRKTFDNRSGGAVSTRYRIDSLNLGLAGNLFDGIGGGANSLSLSLIAGRLNLDGSPNQAADAATTRTAGHYRRLRYAATRQQMITEDLSLFAALSGQWASRNLDSSEKFYLGGVYGVRAYPENEGGGSEGRMFNLELRWRLPAGFNLTGFHDCGQVTVNRNNAFNGAAAPNDYRLRGAGLSLAWQSGSGPSLRASWAHRIGGNPNPAANGNDRDGSLIKHRFWLSASLRF